MTGIKKNPQIKLSVKLNYCFQYKHVWDQRRFIDARRLETLDREIKTQI